MLDSSYFVVYLARTNHTTPLDGAGPDLYETIGNFHTLTQDITDIANWDQTLKGGPTTSTHGVWNAGTTYAVNNTVSSSHYSIQTATGTVLLPMIYTSLYSGNIGHDPDSYDGWWTCITRPIGAANSNWVPIRFGYILNPLITPSVLAAAYTSLMMWHTVPWTVAPPGDVVQFSDVYFQLNYKSAAGGITSIISHPLIANLFAQPPSQGQVLNPGPQATIQNWHTSGLSDPPGFVLSGFEPKIVPDGNGPQPSGQVGTFYLSIVTATGGVPPYTFSLIDGTLPPGVVLNSLTGELSGVPLSEGNYTFTIRVTDSVAATAISTCSAEIAAPPPVPPEVLFPFEFYELQTPADVETLPVPKKYDQLGPTRFDKIGKIFGFRIRLIATGNTQTMPFKIYGDDSESLPNLNSPFYVGAFPVIPNIDRVYEIQLPKSVNTDVFRLALGPVENPFHRYDVLIKVHASGLPGQARWIPVK